jgi:C1A family cysteine protease
MSLPLSSGGRRYGLGPSPLFHPAYLSLSSVPGLRTTAPPTVYDLEDYTGPKKNQTTLGACVYFSASEHEEFLYRFYKKQEPVFSPLFGYYQGRLLDGTLAQGDCGSTGLTACKVLNQFGLCLESEDPYAPQNFQVAPTAEQLAEAAQYKSGAYHSIFTLDDMKLCLASNYTFLYGMTVYSSFESNVGSNGIVPVPNYTSEQVLGGHEILCFGYDDSKGMLHFRNSWGSDWGENGNFWLPYEMALDPRVFMEARISHFGKPWGAK